MAIADVIFVKGSYTVTVYSAEVNDNFDNGLFIIKPAQSPTNQADGSKTPRIVDLLRVIHQIVIRGYITGTASKTALAVKRELINIWKGAGTAGGAVTMTYDQGASAIGNTGATTTSTLNGYIEKLNFKDVPFDPPSNFESAPENYTDVVRYEVGITFIEGTQA